MLNWRLEQHINVLYLYQIWASADTMGLTSGLRFNIHQIYSLCMGAAMALPYQHICTGSTGPFLCHTVLNAIIKCAGSFDLFLALNQAKLNIL